MTGNDKTLFKIHGFKQGEEPDEKWGAKGKIGFVTKAPCERCNNGWMSQLEINVAPMLTPMILCKKATITPEQQEVIARWVTKVAMNWEFFRRRDPLYFTHAERHALATTGALPGRTMYFVGHYRDKVTKEDGQTIVPAGLMNEYDLTLQHDDDGRPVTSPAFVMTFSVGHLALQLFSYRWPVGLTFHVKGKWDNAILWIGHPTASPIEWPVNGYMDDEVMHTFAERWRNLSPVAL